MLSNPISCWFAARGGRITLLITDRLCADDFPPSTSSDGLQIKTNFFFFFYYSSSIPERHGPLPQTICSCFVRSELATSWSHEMKTKCPMCGGGAGCSATAECSSAHRLWSPTGAPRAPAAAKNSLEAWGTCGLTCCGVEHYLRNQRRGLGLDSIRTVRPLSECWLATYMAQGCVYVIGHWPFVE